ELSGSANIGTISADGLFIADKVGNGKISAKVGELSASVNMEVMPGIPAFILVEPSLVSISSQSAEKRVFSAIFKDLRGNTVIDTTGVKLTWSVIGDIGAIEPSTGVFINKTGIYESRTGYVNVTATFNQGTAKENKLLGRCAVVLQPAPKPLALITVTPNSVSIIKGDTQKFSAVGKNIDGLEMELKPQWRVISSDGKTEIKGAIFDGIFSATSEISVGSSWKVQASAINSEGKNIIGGAVANIIAGLLQSIEITCTEDSTKPFESGKTLELTATGYDKYRNIIEISPNWRVVGQIGTVSPQSKNLVPPSDGRKAVWSAGLVGSGEVVAESSGKEGKVHLAVIHGKLDHILISTFPQSDLFIGSNESNPLIIKSGSSITFKATGSDSDKDELGRSKAVNSFGISSDWSIKSSNKSINPGSISADGKFVGKEVGSGYIESKSGNISAIFYIKVISGSLFSIKISPSTISLVSGKDLEFKFVPTGYDQQGNQVLIKPVWKTVGGIGTIDENGLLKTAVLPSGTSSISGAVVASQGAIEGSSTVKIVSAIGELSKIVLTIEPSNIQAGSKATCLVKGFDDFGNPITKLPSIDLRLETRDLRLEPQSSIFNLQSSILLGSLTPSDTHDTWIFRAVEQLPIERNGKITASIDANGKILIAEATLSLVPAPLDKIVVDPSTLSVSAGEKQRFRAYGNDVYGNTIDLLAAEWGVLGGVGKVTWDPKLSQECVFLATTTGEGQLVISSQNHEGKANIRVIHGQIETLEIQPKSLTIESGKTQKFITIAKDSYGNIADDLKRQWQISDENIGSVTDDGMFAAKRAGSGTIKVLYESVSDEASVTVTHGEMSSAEIIIESEGFLARPYNLISGNTYLLYLRGFDSYKNEILQLDEVAWKISNGMGLINSDAGKFILTALFPGSGDISASTGKISISSDINITPYAQNVISTNGALIKGAFDAQIEILPNSIRKDTTISISLSPTVGLVQSAKRIGYVYKLEPEGMILSIPAKLTLSYKYVKTSDIDESHLSIYFWDKFQQKWLRAGGNVDSKQKTLTANINYLSLFAIMQASEQIFTSENRIEAKLSPNAYFAPEVNRLTIRYNIGWKSYQLVNVTISIYDIKGNLVRELVNKIPKYPGWNAEQWDGTDESGKVVKNGRYFVVITGESNGEKISKTSHLAIFR
ncbi:MAG: FlgD immunoglobulin-like domain containing protein, partial [Candidatus Poribacteria bacterium]